MTEHLLFPQASWPWFASLVFAMFAGARLERTRARLRRTSRRQASRFAWRTRPKAAASPPPFDAAEQLRSVERASFRTKRLLNAGETRLFGVLERACAIEAPDWKVMAQVSLGEILSSPDADAYRAINSKRVDLLIIGADGYPVHAVEFQGDGHHLGPAATRDAIKKEALRKAGVGYVEVVPGDTPAEIRSHIAKLVRGAELRNSA